MTGLVQTVLQQPTGLFVFMCVFMPAAEQSSQVMTQQSDPQTADQAREQVCPDMVLRPNSLHLQFVGKERQRVIANE